MLALVPQHGAESHFVRPDGVTRSSILQAIPGFAPVENAQGVALRFTQPHYFALTVPSNGGAVSGLAGFAAGGIPLWQRIRLSVQAAFARARATAVMRRAALHGLGGFGNSDVPYEAVTSLPNAFSPGQYGIRSANDQMSMVAMRITAGLPPQVTMPAVAQSHYQAAAAIAPNYAAMPAQLAARAQAYVPQGIVSSAAMHRALDFFTRLRTWWYG